MIRAARFVLDSEFVLLAQIAGKYLASEVQSLTFYLRWPVMSDADLKYGAPSAAEANGPMQRSDV